MKYWFGAILVFFAMAGAGCAVFSHPSGVPQAEEVPETESISGLIGVVITSDQEAHTLSLMIPDGSIEDVSYGAGLDIAGAKAGTLLHIDGARDRSTRVVRATSVAVEQSSGIRLTAPTSGATVTSPLVAFGFAKTETGTIEWRLRDRTGAESRQGVAAVVAPTVGGFGAFRIDAFLPAMKDTSFTLELSVRAHPASVVETVSVPLVLLSSGSVTFDVYFPHAQKGSARDCSQVFPVPRTLAKTSAVARAALLELMKGPSLSERQEGYSTPIPSQAALRSLAIVDRSATADFTGPLAWAGGTCALASIRAQIAQTLLQFPALDTVSVHVDGKTVPSLQP